MSEISSVTMPPFTPAWLDAVNPGVMDDVAQDIVNTLTATFLWYGAMDPILGERISYPRTVIGHGDVVVEPAKESGAGYQLLVALTSGPELGQAGEVQFRFPQGAPGKYGFEYIVITAEIWHPWPTRGNTPQLPIAPDTIEKYRRALWWNGRLMWGAIKTVALGGIQPPLAVLGSRQDQVHLGPLTPVAPKGAVAGFRLPIAIQL